MWKFILFLLAIVLIFGISGLMTFAFWVLAAVGLAVVIPLLLGFFRTKANSVSKTLQSDDQETDMIVNLVRITEDYKGDYWNESIPIEIYRYCVSNPNLRSIISFYRVDENVVGEIYTSLLKSCYIDTGAYFIPIAAFFFEDSLEYIISNRIKNQTDAYKVAEELKYYFTKV